MTADDLKRFCADEDDIRYYLRAPWTRDGFTWATNGHILVRVPAMAEVPENKEAPDTLQLLDKQTPPALTASYVPVPTIKLPDPVECETCDGEGAHVCLRCDEEHRCGHCAGAGKVQAPIVKIAVGESVFQDRLLALIQGWEIAPNGERAAWIRNGDVLGLLMPMIFAR